MIKVTNSFKYAVVDDNLADCEKLASLVLHVDSAGTVHCFQSLTSFLESNEEYDLLILDVKLNEGISIYMSHIFSKKTRYILYASVSRSMIELSFNQNVLGFLIKTDDDITNANKLQKAIDHINRSIYVRTDMGMATLPLDSVILITRKEESLSICLKSGKELHVLDTSLRKLLKAADNTWIQADRKTIININQIMKISGNIVYLADQHEVKPSRRQLTAIKAAFLRSIQL